jgi:hypothetical protein
LSTFTIFIIMVSPSSSLFGFDLLDGVVSMSNFVSVHVGEVEHDDDFVDDENMTAVENENPPRESSDSSSGASSVTNDMRSSPDSALAETLSEWSLPSASSSSSSYHPPTLASNETNNTVTNDSGTSRSSHHPGGGCITILSSAPTNETPMFSLSTPYRREYPSFVPRFGGAPRTSDLSLSLTTADSVYTDAEGFGSSAHVADVGGSSSFLSLNPSSLPSELIISLPDSFSNERRSSFPNHFRQYAIDPHRLLAVDLLSPYRPALASSICATVEDDASRYWDDQSNESQAVVTIRSEITTMTMAVKSVRTIVTTTPKFGTPN